MCQELLYVMRDSVVNKTDKTFWTQGTSILAGTGIQ